jgi:hypothetical protein
MSGSLKGHMIAYIVSIFPAWSETFIVREVLALRRRGAQVQFFSLKPAKPNQGYVHEAARMLHKEVVYPHDINRLAEQLEGIFLESTGSEPTGIPRYNHTLTREL